MTFEEILTQAIAMLQRQGRVAYRALTRQFDLDADYLEDLKEAILYAHPQVIDDGRGLVWTGEATTPTPVPPPATLVPLPALQEVPPPQRVWPRPSRCIASCARAVLRVGWTLRPCEA